MSRADHLAKLKPLSTNLNFVSDTYKGVQGFLTSEQSSMRQMQTRQNGGGGLENKHILVSSHHPDFGLACKPGMTYHYENLLSSKHQQDMANMDVLTET